MQLIRKIKKLGFKLGFQKLIGYEAIFSCAFCTREPGRELYKECDIKNKAFQVLPHSEKFWYADPLLWEKEGREVVFLERMDRYTGRGCIVCVDITGGVWSEPKPVICEEYHMSFPMCFEWGGELYMIPETEENCSVNLYRCVSFPEKWEKAGEYLKGRKLVDSVVWDKGEDRICFLASEYNPEDDFYTRFYRYELLRKGNAVEVRDLGRVSSEYTLSSRMAGPVTEEQMAPVQRSTSGVYGYSVQFCKKDEEIPGQQVKELLPAEFEHMGHKLLGVHTYSQSSHYEMIDIQYLVYNKNKWKKRK